MVKLRKILLAVAVSLLALGVWRVAAQEPRTPANPVAAADQKIIEEIKANNEIMRNLEYLSDVIGARLTGTPQMTQASQWTMRMFQNYGLSSVHLEPWTIAHAWFRGTARGRIVSPSVHVLTIASAGWAPGTNGVLRGPVVYVEAQKPEDLDQYKGKLKGAIVITAKPATLPGPYEIPRSPMLAPPPPPPPLPGQPPAPSPFAQFARMAQARETFFKQEGVAAVLRDSGKPHGLLNMTGVGGRDYKITDMPTAFISSESYSLIWRLVQRGPVEVELDITNSFSDKPVEVYNTVAEIPGSEKPDEVVILGAHLDSWDLGTGTTDNGTGSMAVLEAARALRKLAAQGLRPKRTIRFVLFSGEEQGLVGSRKYVEAHKAELSKIDGVLVHDTGTGRVLSIGLQANYQDREVMDRIVAPLRTLGLLELSMRGIRGTDHASFDDAGVPGFYCIQDPAEYGKTHHSQSDTFDKAWKDDLIQGAQVLAAWAYNVAEYPEMLPRSATPPGPAPAEGN